MLRNDYRRQSRSFSGVEEFNKQHKEEADNQSSSSTESWESIDNQKVFRRGSITINK